MNHLEAVNTFASERYLMDEMSEFERHAFEEHFFSCPDCAEDIRVGALMREGAAAAKLPGNAHEAGLAGRRWLWFPTSPAGGFQWVPWAAAATLALVVGYQRYQGYQGDEDRQSRLSNPGAVALLPATLRPATRGEEPVVRPGPGGVTTLAVDLGGGGFGDIIRYELKRADDSIVASGDLPAPAPGAPLLLLIPPRTLRSSEHYVLRLQNPRSATLTFQDYRFTVGAP